MAILKLFSSIYNDIQFSGRWWNITSTFFELGDEDEWSDIKMLLACFSQLKSLHLVVVADTDEDPKEIAAGTDEDPVKTLDQSLDRLSFQIMSKNSFDLVKKILKCWRAVKNLSIVCDVFQICAISCSSPTQ